LVWFDWVFMYNEEGDGLFFKGFMFSQ